MKCLQPPGVSQWQPLPLGLEWDEGFHGHLRWSPTGIFNLFWEAALGCSPRLCTARGLRLEVLGGSRDCLAL